MPVAPSPVPLPGTIFTPDGHQPAVVPRELTVAQIRSTVADFATAARNALDAGFAGVEVHSANGHLLHQFLARGTNHRTDAYGGPVSRRIRFVVEVVRAVAAEIGADRVGVRVSPAARSTASRRATRRPSTSRSPGPSPPLGLAYLHLVRADPEEPLFHRIRAAWPGPLIANPVLPETFTADDVHRAAARLLDTGAELIALGRPFLANPDLVERLRLGAPLNQVRDRYMMYVGGATGYTDYPALVTCPVSRPATRSSRSTAPASPEGPAPRPPPRPAPVPRSARSAWRGRWWTSRGRAVPR